MNIFDRADEGFDDFALPPELTELSTPTPLKFAPWHKPRKQFVRERQWVHHAKATIGRLKQEGKISSNDTVSYLTLPGPDMLDVRMMAEMCKAENLKLKYTGFCSVREEEADRLRRNTSQFHLDLDDAIQKGSEVNQSRLEEIIIKGSSAQMTLQQGGPYLIVNIDACEPLINRSARETARLIDAIKEILKFQFNSTRLPWLLYLTTPVQSDWVDQESLSIFKHEVSQNAIRDGEFARRLAEYYQSGEGLAEFLERSFSKSGRQFCAVFSLGFAKWALHISEQANFKMIKKESFCYSMLSREPAFPNMISTCYLFQPLAINLVDRMGLTAEPSTQQQTTAPKSPHIHALERSLSLVDLDEKLLNETELLSGLVESSKNYLRRVGYLVDDPEAGYDAWLKREMLRVVENAEA